MIEAIALGTLKKIAPPILKKAGGQAQTVYQELKAKVSNASHKYNRNYRDRHGKLKVFCTGMREPIPLDDVYVAVQFLDERSASKFRSLEEVRKVFRAKYEPVIRLNYGERRDGMQVANDKQYLMVLGGPGIGKSTFLRKIGLEALKEKDGKFEHNCIPVFLELKRFTKDRIDIESLITHEFKICGYPAPSQMTKTALESGDLLILFDGLDEVPAENVDNVIRDIGDFVDLHSANRFIASCRIAAYKGGFTQFTEVEIADFDDMQVRAYINNWFASTPDPYRRQLDEELRTADQCWTALNETQHQATFELARNPLLLTFLCMVYDYSQNFPRDRVGLYEKALNIFLEEWMAEKRVRRETSARQYLDVPTEKRMLYEIAATNLEANRLFFGADELVAQIKEFGAGSTNTPSTFDASKILEAVVVEQGLFVERVSGFYSFSHLTFQEYLTANYFAVDTTSIQVLVTRHLHKKEWEEVFLMTAGLMHKADNLLETMKVAAFRCINTPKLKELIRWAKCITNTTDDRYGEASKRAFAIRQYFSLWLLNKVNECIRNDSSRDRELHHDISSYNKLELCFHLDRELYRDLYRGLYQNEELSPIFYVQRLLNIRLDRELYRELARNLCSDPIVNYYWNPDINFYLDFYRYTNTDSNPDVVSKFSDRIDQELIERLGLLSNMKKAKIFKGVDLQRMVRKFNEQRKFISAVRDGGSFKPPRESLHDTWLSVLHITEAMLSISRHEMENYIKYLHALELIAKCKDAAGRVTPEIWKRVEYQLRTWDVEEVKN